MSVEISGKTLNLNGLVPPTIPQNLTVVAGSPTSSELNISWDASTDAETFVASYRLYRDGSLITDANILSYVDSGLTDATTYSYQVSAVDSEGNESSKSLPVQGSTTDGTAPTVPTNLFVSLGNPTDSVMEISWDASTDNVGVVGYKLYRDGGLISNQAGLAFTDTGLTVNTLYTYTVLAYDAVGNESAQSTGISETTIDTIAPTVPDNLNAVDTSPLGFTLDISWSASTDNIGVAGYKLYRDGGLVSDQAGLTFTDTGLGDITQYSYTVLAYDAAGNESAQSTANIVTTPDGTAPSVPLNLAAVDGLTPGTTVDLSWDASTDNVGVTGYKLYRDGGLISDQIGLTFTDTGRTDATLYTYNVLAYDAVGNESAQSLDVTITTVDITAPTAPSGLTVIAGTPTGSVLDIEWDASTDNVGVTGYKLTRDGGLISDQVGLTFSDTGLNDGVVYSYNVLAYDAAGNESVQFNPVAVRTPDITAPSVPTGLAVVLGNPTDDTLVVTWNASTDNVGVAGYKVYRDGGLVSTQTGLSFTDTGLSTEVTYNYKVLAYDAAGNESAQSAGVDGTTVASPIATVTPIDFIATNSITMYGGAYRVDWGDGNNISYADGVAASAVATGTILVTSIENPNRITFNSNTFVSIDITNGTKLTSFASMCLDLRALTSFSASKTQNVIDFSNAWNDCRGLVTFPYIDTSAGTNFYRTWYSCQGMISFPALNLSLGTNFTNTWAFCIAMPSYPSMNFSQGILFDGTWWNNNKLEFLPPVDTVNGTNFNNCFRDCTIMKCLHSLNTTSATTTVLIWDGSNQITNPTSAERTALADVFAGGLDYTNANPCP